MSVRKPELTPPLQSITKFPNDPFSYVVKSYDIDFNILRIQKNWKKFEVNMVYVEEASQLPQLDIFPSYTATEHKIILSDSENSLPKSQQKVPEKVFQAFFLIPKTFQNKIPVPKTSRVKLFSNQH